MLQNTTFDIYMYYNCFFMGFFIAPLLGADSPHAIDGEYIVVFRDGVDVKQGISLRLY